MRADTLYVTKMSGERSLFNEEKLRNSLRRSKADENTINQIVGDVKSGLYDSIPTHEIYKSAFSMLRKKAAPSASRYKLKRALFELGPTGFPFEKYVNELLKFVGYTTEINIFVQGHCVMHEVDIIAERRNRHLIIECKFHSDQRRFCDVKDPLYIHSRFQDIKTKFIEDAPPPNDRNYQGGLITNTRFSSDALTYGRCMDMFMLSWDYPAERSLKSLIDQSGLYPVTTLLSITKFEKKQLLDKGVVLCKSLISNKKLLRDIGISDSRIRKVIAEIESFCDASAS